MKFVFAILMAMLLIGCTAHDEAYRILSGAGLKKIEITGYRFFGCGEDDRFHTGFKAVGPNGQPVTGVVCSGFLKGGTIRYD